MDGYRIGEVAEFLSLSSESLRNYERHGIVQSRRNQETGYRYFTAWEINYLLDCTYYRGFGFSMEDCKTIINDADLDQLIDLYQAHSIDLFQQVQIAQMKLDATSRFLEQLRTIRSKLGYFSPTTSPSFLFHPIRHNGKLHFEREDMEAHAFWNQHKPFIQNTFYLPTRNDDDSFDSYFWGYSIPARDYTDFAAGILKQAEYIPSYKSVYTVFCAHDENTFLHCFRDQVVEPLRAQGYHILRDRVVGNLLGRVHENDHICRYCEVWVPVE